MSDTTRQRTEAQNRSLHRYFEILSDFLNDAGLDQRRVLKQSVNIPWTREAIKEQLWKPIQELQLAKKSTTELTTKEIDVILDTLISHLGEKFGVTLPSFPSIQNLIHDRESEEAVGKRRG